MGEQIIAGTLTAVSGSPWTMPATPYSMALTPSGNYLYVSTTAGVYVYPVSSGALGAATEVSQDADALAIQVDPSGTWLIEALQATSGGGVTIAAVPLKTSNGQNNGAEQAVTFSVAGAALQYGKMAISSDDKYILTALGAGGTMIVSFNASAASGTNPIGSSANTVPVANTSGSAVSVAVDPNLRLFYIGEILGDTAGTSGGLRVFEYSSIGSGTLVQASGSPVASGGLAPNAILPVGSGYVYVANGAGTSAGTINSLSVSGTSGAYSIATGSKASSGVNPYALAEDGNDTFLLAVNQSGSTYFSSYTFASTAGELVDQIFTNNTGTTPIAIVAVP